MLSCLTLKLFLSLTISTLLELNPALLISSLGIAVRDVTVNIPALRIPVEIALIISTAHGVLTLNDLPRTKDNTLSEKLLD